MKRVVFLLTVAAICSLGLAGPASAAAPLHDTYATRTVVDGLPFGDSVDTTEATTDAIDAEASLDCGAPATDASVWYQYTPTADGQVVVDASGSDYAVGILVVTGLPGSFALLACGPDALAVTATTGEPLTILVFDYDQIGNGGNLSLAIDVIPPPPSLELSVSATGSVDPRTGAAVVAGTVTCSGGGELVKTFIEVHLSQMVGRFRIQAPGEGGTFACTGAPEAWAVEVIGQNGRLSGGKATVSVMAFACTFTCSTVAADRVITLRR